MGRENWYASHPAYCTCWRCNLAGRVRLDPGVSSDSLFASRRRGKRRTWLIVAIFVIGGGVGLQLGGALPSSIQPYTDRVEGHVKGWGESVWALVNPVEAPVSKDQGTTDVHARTDRHEGKEDQGLTLAEQYRIAYGLPKQDPGKDQGTTATEQLEASLALVDTYPGGWSTGTALVKEALAKDLGGGEDSILPKQDPGKDQGTTTTEQLEASLALVDRYPGGWSTGTALVKEALAVASPTPSPTLTKTPTPSLTNTPIATPSATAMVASFSFSLRGFTNGPWLEQQDPQLASSINKLGWIQDSIDNTESEAIQDLLYIVVTSRSVAASIVSLGWVQDGIDDVEAEAIHWMTNIGSAEVASSVVSLGWVQDGIGSLETQAIEEISYLSHEHTVAALSVVGMPFIETIEPPDISAVASLWKLAADDLGSLEMVMSHEALRDGISDDLAPVVATLHSVAATNPSLIDVLLDPTRVFLERRTTTLPLAGDVVLGIIRTAPGAARSMDLLEHAVRGAEEFMGSPLPTSYVGLLYENAVSGSSAGTNLGTHIAILPKYDIDDDSHEAGFAGSNIAHEVAHYYWSGNEDWVDEGAADFMASIVEGARTGQPIGVTNLPCAYARTIAELENLGISRGGIEFHCNYSLGERLFVDLHLTLGDERFRQGLRALYLASSSISDADDRRGTSGGIEHVREAFRSDDEAESTVIARWYNGAEPYDLSRLDPSPVDPGLTGINGRIDEAYIITGTNGPGVTVFSAQDVADWIYLTLKYSYKVSGATREVPLEIVEYYEDGFQFRRSSHTLSAKARYIGGTSWFSVGQSPPRKWAPGHYVVYVYAGERKVAEVEYEVTP